MLNDYLKLVQDCIASFKEEWKLLSPPPTKTPPSFKEIVPEKKVAIPPPSLKQSQANRLEKTTGDQIAPSAAKATLESPSQIQQLLHKVAPSLRLRKQPLDDTAATRLMQAWQEYVGEVDAILLATSKDKETLELIKSLAKNIVQKKVGSVKALLVERLEQEKKWDLFLSKNKPKLLIASKGLLQMQNAMSYYRLNTATAQGFLATTPLLVLAAPSLYKESAQEKIALWNILCRLLKS